MELNPEWVVGFVDGEGCFHVSVNKHAGMSVGYQVLPEFVIVQHNRDRQILQSLKRFFGGGVVRKNHDDRDCLRIRNREVLDRVCEFFLQHPLKTRKNVDFRKFRSVLQLMDKGSHLTREGLLEIVKVITTMNTCQRPSLEQVKVALSLG